MHKQIRTAGETVQRPTRSRVVVGWIAVSLCTLISAVWAFWGSIETFHEGWYYQSFLLNVGLMLIQYLAPALVFLILCVVSIRWPRIGAVLFLLAGIAFVVWMLQKSLGNLAVALLILAPLLVIGLLFWYGRPRPHRLAYALAIGLPLLTMLIAGTPSAIRVAGRVNDGNYNVRLVKGNGVTLLWAAQGPGWPADGGATWEEATRACSYLDRDGRTLAATPQGIWRLPTIDEAVRSQVRHGQNAGGTWNTQTGRATYTVQPDKDTPLWNSYSPVIYWWTATAVNAREAYRITYNGDVNPWPKTDHPNYLTFRCVMPPPD